MMMTSLGDPPQAGFASSKCRRHPPRDAPPVHQCARSTQAKEISTRAAEHLKRVQGQRDVRGGLPLQAGKRPTADTGRRAARTSGRSCRPASGPEPAGSPAGPAMKPGATIARSGSRQLGKQRIDSGGENEQTTTPGRRKRAGGRSLPATVFIAVRQTGSDIELHGYSALSAECVFRYGKPAPDVSGGAQAMPIWPSARLQPVPHELEQVWRRQLIGDLRHPSRRASRHRLGARERGQIPQGLFGRRSCAHASIPNTRVAALLQCVRPTAKYHRVATFKRATSRTTVSANRRAVPLDGRLSSAKP